MCPCRLGYGDVPLPKQDPARPPCGSSGLPAALLQAWVRCCPCSLGYGSVPLQTGARQPPCSRSGLPASLPQARVRLCPCPLGYGCAPVDLHPVGHPADAAVSHLASPGSGTVCVPAGSGTVIVPLPDQMPHGHPAAAAVCLAACSMLGYGVCPCSLGYGGAPANHDPSDHPAGAVVSQLAFFGLGYGLCPCPLGYGLVPLLNRIPHGLPTSAAVGLPSPARPGYGSVPLYGVGTVLRPRRTLPAEARTPSRPGAPAGRAAAQALKRFGGCRSRSNLGIVNVSAGRPICH